MGAKWTEFGLDGVNIPDGRTPAQVSKFDRNAGDWTIPRERMKVKKEERGPHTVPLPPRLLAALRQWRDADGPNAMYVCPAPREPTCRTTDDEREALEQLRAGLVELEGAPVTRH